jgi:hypothetical protein
VLATAEGSQNYRLQRAASAARKTIELVQELTDKERDKSAARAEVERLEAELAAAKAKLRGDATVKNPRGAAKVKQPVGVPYSEVRRWAQEQGIDVPAAGRITNAALQAYIDAHPQ